MYPRERIPIPRGSICTTIMELGPKDHPYYGFGDPNSIIGVYMDPLGVYLCPQTLQNLCPQTLQNGRF